MIKKIFSTLISIIMITGMMLSFTSCHRAENLNEFSVPDTFDMNKEYNITFWAKNDTNVAQTKIYNNAVENFEKLYPNIHVTIRFYTDYGKIYNDVITNISTGTTPNVCITYPDHIATYMTGTNVVVPLDDLFQDPEYGLGGSEVLFDSPSYYDIVPEFLNECVIGTKHYAIPFMRSTEACYVNKDFVEALGYTMPDILTWDFVWEVSEKATQKDSDGNFMLNGQKTLIPFIYKSTDNMMIQMLRQLGAGYSTEFGSIDIFNNTTKELLNEIGLHAESGAFSTFKISSYPANFLNAGQCIFAIDSTAGSTWMGTNAPNCDISKDKLVDFETVVYPVPQYDINNPQMISQGPSICIFNKDDEGEVLASWLFASYLLTNDVQIGYAQTEGYVPVTLSAQNSSTYIDYITGTNINDDLHYSIKLKASELLINNVNNTFVTPVFNGSASLRNAAGELIENVVKAKRRHQEVNDDTITQMFDDVNSLYRLDQVGIASATGNVKDLGPLPNTAVILLTTLAVTWVLICAYVVIDNVMKKKH